MSNKFDGYKQSLVNFFKDAGYLGYGKTINKKVTYLYAKDEKIQVIKITYMKKKLQNKADQELDYLKEELGQQLEISPQAVNVVEIYFTDHFENNFVRNDNTTIVITNSWDYLTHSLAIDFPKLANLEDPESLAVAESEKMTSEDFNLEEIKSTDDLNKRLSILNLQLRNGNSLATMIIAILFLITPFVIGIAATFVVKGQVTVGTKALIFGGSTYTLTFLGGQWWRIFTFGFSSGENIFGLVVMVLFAWMGFKRLRLNELMMGTWKMLGTFILAYLISGFFLSVLSSDVISGGQPIVFAIILGMIALNAGGSKSALASMAKNQLIGPIVLLVFYGFFASASGDTEAIFAFIIGFIAGGTMAFMVTYDYQEINWRLGVGIVLVLAFILIPIAMLLIQTYLPGVDGNVVNSLLSYVDLKLMSVDNANKVLQKIGWSNVQIKQVGDYIWPMIY